MCLPFLADAAEEIGEDITGAAPFGTMHYDQVCGRKFEAWIQVSDSFVIPFGDFSQKDVRDNWSVQFKSWVPGKIIGDNDGASDGRNVKDLPWSFGQIFIAHGPIGSAKINGLGQNLFLSAA